MDDINSYLAANGARFEEELCELLRIPSISADSQYKPAVAQAADWLAKQFQSLGFTTQVHPTAGHPIVTARSPQVAGAHDRARLWALRRAAR